jgi:hypothetical protein
VTTKSDFTTEEWNRLLQSPVLAGLYVIFSDPNITGMFREMSVLIKSVYEQPVLEAAQELVGELVVDFKVQTQVDEHLPGSEDISKGKPGEVKREMLEFVKGIAVLVDAKATADEAAGFKEWLFNVARAVSEEAREGGFLGMGGERVSDKEEAALENLKYTLRL